MGTSILRTVLFVAAAAATAIAVEPGAPLDAWVLVGAADSNHMSGSLHDLERARKLIGGGPALFVRHKGQEWIIRDAKLVARARALMAPLDELGRLEGALGEKQGALGEQQGALGQKMGRLEHELRHDPKGYERQMEELGRQMERLGELQSALGGKQEELGARMEQAAREMEARLAALVDEARAGGLAQPAK
jgi:bla regulator protein blaR1